MIFITVKYQVKPELAGSFIDAMREFTEATRAEVGNKWFDWFRSVNDPNQFVLLEAFDDDAGEAHVSSAHFARGLETMRPFLESTPKIISRLIEGDDWDLMSELHIG